jgi:hypothetical protein
VIASDQLVTALATAAFPTFAVLIGILVNNQRLNDFTRSVDVRFADTNRHIEDSKHLLRGEIEILRGEMFRMEQVLDARLKHLEEHFQS